MAGGLPESFQETVKVDPPVTEAPGVGETKSTSPRTEGVEDKRMAKRIEGLMEGRIFGGVWWVRSLYCYWYAIDWTEDANERRRRIDRG